MKTGYMETQLRKYPPFVLLLRLTLPAMFAQIFNAMYTLVDRMFIGHMEKSGTLALSGLGICFPIISLVTAFAWLIGMGGGPLLSICMGEQRNEEAEKIQSESFTLLLILGVIITLSCYFFANPILTLFGASAQILPYAAEYLRIYILGSTCTLVAMGMNSFINAQGRTVLGTVTIMLGAFLNIILDYVLICILHMGIRGAALATVVSQIVSALWVLYQLFLSRRMTVRISLAGMKLSRIHVKKILSLGASSFIFMANECVIQILLNHLIRLWMGYNASGDLYIGALTIISSLAQLFFMPLQGITQGTQPIVGYCKGAGKWKRLLVTVRDAKILGTCSAVTFWCFFLFAPRIVASMFTADPQLLTLSEHLIRIYFWECFLFGVQMINQHMFVAIGNAKYSFWFAIMRKILLLIPLVCILPLFLGVDGIFLAESISTVITVITTQIVFTKYLKKMMKSDQKYMEREV